MRGGARTGWLMLVAGGAVIAAAILALWEVAEHTVFAGASVGTIHKLHLVRGFATALALMGWAAVRMSRRMGERPGPRDGRHGGARTEWLVLVAGGALIAAAILALWEVAEHTWFAGLPLRAMERVHLVRGFATALALMGWAAVWVRSLWARQERELRRIVREQAAELVVQKELSYRLVTEAPTGIAVIGGAGRFELTNASFCRAFGGPEDRPRDCASCRALEIPELRSVVDDVRSSGRPRHAVEACARCPRAEESRFVRLGVASLSGPADPGASRLLVMVEDVTEVTAERRRAEEAIREKAKQLETVTEAMEKFVQTGDWRASSAVLLREALRQTSSEYGFTGVVVAGPVLRVLAYEGVEWDLAVNRALLDKALREISEKGHFEFRRTDSLYGAAISEKRAVISNDPARDPRACGVPPGHPPLRAFLGVPFLQGGEVVGLIGVANRPDGYTGVEEAALNLLSRAAAVLYDTYRRREREKALEVQFQQAQKMEAVGRLAGGVAHDFNNLLTAILGYADLLGRMLPADGPQPSHLREIRLAGERAASLTRQLLMFSRKQVVAPRVLDMNDVVREMEKMLRRMIGEDIELAISAAADLGRVRADRGQIEQVLMNLAVNARDAMPDGGCLTIETANVELRGEEVDAEFAIAPGSFVVLSVRDTGCGMDAETRRHIFEPFFTTKEVGKGTGLGLATVYGIVRQTGGAIQVETAPGEGATFRICLPRVDQPVDTEPRAPERAEARSAGETILLVEDDERVRLLAAAILKAEGYRVLEAAAGPAALELCANHPGPIHLILTDVIMPGMSGRALAEAARRIRPDARVLYMSGYSDDHIARHGVLEPGMQIVEKPFEVAHLFEKVRSALRSGNR